jgi:hypothetical protein
MERRNWSNPQCRIEQWATIEAKVRQTWLRVRVLNEHGQLPKSAIRYIDASSRSFLERLQDMWFAPKHFESTALYERLGVLLVKRYAPTGGDFVNRRYGVTIADIHGTLDSLIRYERMTRRLEAIHVIVFLGFLAFSLWRAVTHQTSFLDFGFAVVVYILLILSPAILQRYNRLRVYAAIRRLAARQLRYKRGETSGQARS